MSVARRVIVLRWVLRGNVAIRRNDEQTYLDFVGHKARPPVLSTRSW